MTDYCFPHTTIYYYCCSSAAGCVHGLIDGCIITALYTAVIRRGIYLIDGMQDGAEGTTA